MSGRLRTISLYLLSAAMTMLLAIRVLPHHHHTLHIPGTLATVEYMHLGAECCDCDGSHTHDDSCECPGEKMLYYTAPCDDLDTYKPQPSCDLQPMIIFYAEEQFLQASAPAHAPPFKIPKIPDKGTGTHSLRAPPTV